jgi:protein SCO1/2
MAAAGVFAALLAPPPARADEPGQFFPSLKSAGNFVPAEVRNVKVIEHLGHRIPLDLSFVDDDNHPVHLRDYFQGKRPVILQMGYLNCPMLCTIISEGMADSIKKVGLNVGSDYEYLFVSIDPDETPDQANLKKQSYEKEYDRPGTAAGWHFLTGKEPDIKKLADAVGFEYKWIAAAHQFSHPAVVVILGPNGKVCRYLYGVKFNPTTVRESLVEASNEQIGNTLDRVFLCCFQWDGTQGQYSWVAIRMMQLGGAVTLLIVGGVLGYLHFFRRERAPVQPVSV